MTTSLDPIATSQLITSTYRRYLQSLMPLREPRLRAALGPYTREAAVVIVAQRVSTIASADNILVLEDGVVIGRGTHDELMRDSATYAEIVQSQIGEKSAA